MGISMLVHFFTLVIFCLYVCFSHQQHVGAESMTDKKDATFTTDHKEYKDKKRKSKEKR